MLVYHGSKTLIPKIDNKYMNIGNNQEGIGIYFSTDINDAKTYGNKIVSMNINKNNFFPSRELIGDFVPKSVLAKFLESCFKSNKKFWYLLTDYGIEISNSNEVTLKHFYELADLMKDEQIRNFQITIAESIGIHNFINIWRKYIKKQGTYYKNFYVVLYGSINKTLKEEILYNINLNK